MRVRTFGEEDAPETPRSELPMVSGQPLEKIAADTERDFWMTAEQAVAYGLVSRVVSRADDA